MERRLTLYLRPGCALCEVMIEELEPYHRRFDFTVEGVDIDADPRLRDRYHDKVPVLAAPDGRELCRYYLDPEILEAYFAGR